MKYIQYFVEGDNHLVSSRELSRMLGPVQSMHLNAGTDEENSVWVRLIQSLREVR